MNATKAEFKDLLLSGTFNDAVKPDNRKAVSSRCVFRWKRDHTGHVVKAKERLVAREFSQIEGIDYWKTFAPTPSMSSMTMLAAFARERDFPLYRLDAEQALV